MGWTWVPKFLKWEEGVDIPFKPETNAPSEYSVAMSQRDHKIQQLEYAVDRLQKSMDALLVHLNITGTDRDKDTRGAALDMVKEYERRAVKNITAIRLENAAYSKWNDLNLKMMDIEYEFPKFKEWR